MGGGGKDEDDALSYILLLYTLNCWVVVTTVVWIAASLVNSDRGSGACGRVGLRDGVCPGFVHSASVKLSVHEVQTQIS